MDKAKPFDISKRQVWEAYKRVKANQGGAGVDGQTIAAFEENLENNLYKLWNRLASGSYFPPPVRRVDIRKRQGTGMRPLGIPTVSDRVGQAVVKAALEPLLEPLFHPDSYGYRLGKSAIDAVGTARQRCWRYDWVLDLDIRSFFDSIDHELLMRAVRKHTTCLWVLLYIERWLKAPVQLADGTLVTPTQGTPQGSVISPILANLFLHYAFDVWMQKHYSQNPFERYADDAICHCRTEAEAKALKSALDQRFAECGLALHPQKTKIVYCKNANRGGNFPDVKFDFLGFTFQPRRSKNKHGKYFISFTPGVSRQSAKVMRRKMRCWRLHLRSDKSLEDLAHMFNATIRGWINYFRHFRPSALYPVLRHLDDTLARWATRKYKRLRGHHRRATQWLARIARRQPQLFAHWPLLQGRG